MSASVTGGALGPCCAHNASERGTLGPNVSSKPAMAPPATSAATGQRGLGLRSANWLNCRGSAWRLSAAKLSIGLGDLGSAACVAALAVRMVLLDEPLIGALDGRPVGSRLKPQNG